MNLNDSGKMSPSPIYSGHVGFVRILGREIRKGLIIESTTESINISDEMIKITASALEANFRKSFPEEVEYLCAINNIKRRLSHFYGPYLEHTVAHDLIKESLSFKKIVTDEFLTGQLVTDPRKINTGLIFRTLVKHPKFEQNKELGWNYAVIIEKSCYNNVIKRCEISSDAYIRTWDEDQDIGILSYMYSARCGTVVVNLDPQSTVCKKRGGSQLLENLACRKIDPSDIGNMSSTELCPEATEWERKEIEKRNKQKTQGKTSKLYRCTHCGARNCTYVEVQRRAIDEAADIDCICISCGLAFIG